MRSIQPKRIESTSRGYVEMHIDKAAVPCGIVKEAVQLCRISCPADLGKLPRQSKASTLQKVINYEQRYAVVNTGIDYVAVETTSLEAPIECISVGS